MLISSFFGKPKNSNFSKKRIISNFEAQIVVSPLSVNFTYTVGLKMKVAGLWTGISVNITAC